MFFTTYCIISHISFKSFGKFFSISSIINESYHILTKLAFICFSLLSFCILVFTSVTRLFLVELFIKSLSFISKNIFSAVFFQIHFA